MAINLFPLYSCPRRVKFPLYINGITLFFRRVKKNTLFSQVYQQHLTSFLNFIPSALILSSGWRGGVRNRVRLNPKRYREGPIKYDLYNNIL